MISEKDWKWFGDVGHFICGRWCRFHLCTQVGEFLVSTVGAYVHPRHGDGSEQKEEEWLKENWPGEDIGAGRKYETMVFRVTGETCDSDECNCGIPGFDSSELNARCYNKAGDAAVGHMELCRKYAEKPLNEKGE